MLRAVSKIISKKTTQLAVQEITAADMKRVNKLMLDAAGSKVKLVPDVAGHILEAGGKRLRPIITLTTAAMSGYKGEDHIYLAAAVEFLHTASLLHDDVVDESKLRRGRPTANAVWSNKTSVLVGDFVNTQAFLMMLKTRSLAALDVLATTARDIAEGEVMQLADSSDIELGEARYREIIAAKTAALFSAAAELGAVVAGRDELRAALREYGYHLGMAFQMADDALDYAGTAAMGKNNGTDFFEGKVTLPVIIAYATADKNSRRRIKELFSADAVRTASGLGEITAIINTCGATEIALDKAKTEAELAISALKDIEISEYKTALIEVAEFAVARNS